MSLTVDRETHLLGWVDFDFGCSTGEIPAVAHYASTRRATRRTGSAASSPHGERCISSRSGTRKRTAPSLAGADGQGESVSLWMQLRRGRITASNLKQIICNPKQYAQMLWKEKPSLENVKSIQWGNKNESVAREEYVKFKRLDFSLVKPTHLLVQAQMVC